MPDDKTKTDIRDRSRVAGNEEYEVQHFAEEAGITLEQARTLIQRHGNNRAELHTLAESLKRAN